jgi:hypothetical protein
MRQAVVEDLPLVLLLQRFCLGTRCDGVGQHFSARARACGPQTTVASNSVRKFATPRLTFVAAYN